jgi:hypothetical protein
MNLKLPLKVSKMSFFYAMPYSIQDADGVTVALLMKFETAEALVSTVNNYEVMQAKLDKAVELLEACEPFIKQFAPNVLAPELESALKELKGE